MKCLLALDQGTTSSRAMIFSQSGAIISQAQQEFRQYYPRPGWVEHDPEEIWSSQLHAVRRAISDGNVNPADIVALGLTNQRETAVLWERDTGRPVCPAIVWQDRRSSGICDRLRNAGYERLFREKTGLLLDPYFSATKLVWLFEQHPNLRQRAESGDLAFGTVDSWLLWKLTGGKCHLTDASNASRTLLYNLLSGHWDEDLLNILDLPAAILPEIVDSSGLCAQTDPGLFGAAIPVAGIAGDQQAALYGHGCSTPGTTKNTYGTGCFMLMQTGTSPIVSKNRLISTVAWQINGLRHYALEGSVFNAGAAIQWLRDGLGLIRTSNECEILAQTVDDSGGVILVPAFSGLGAPYWDPYARGLLIGLTRGSTAGHIARATLESIALQSADILFAMQNDAGLTLPELRVDGGATGNKLLMQFQADLLGVPVIRPLQSEVTVYGAAALAAHATGFWPDHQAGEAGDEISRFLPQMHKTRVEEKLQRWHRAVERCRNWDLP